MSRHDWEADTLRAELAAEKKRADEAEAQAAAMRATVCEHFIAEPSEYQDEDGDGVAFGPITFVCQHCGGHGDTVSAIDHDPKCSYVEIKASVATDAGRAFLERLRAADEKAVKVSLDWQAKFQRQLDNGVEMGRRLASERDAEREAHAATREELRREQQHHWEAAAMFGEAKRERDEARAALAKVRHDCDEMIRVHDEVERDRDHWKAATERADAALAKAEEENARLRNEWANDRAALGDAVEDRDNLQAAHERTKAELEHAMKDVQAFAEMQRRAGEGLQRVVRERDAAQATVAMLAEALRPFAEAYYWPVNGGHQLRSNAPSREAVDVAKRAISDSAVKRAVELDGARRAVVDACRAVIVDEILNTHAGEVIAYALARLAELDAKGATE